MDAKGTSGVELVDPYPQEEGSTEVQQVYQPLQY